MSAVVAGRGTRGAALAEGAGGRRLLPSGTGMAGSTTRAENRSRGEGGWQAKGGWRAQSGSYGGSGGGGGTGCTRVRRGMTEAGEAPLAHKTPRWHQRRANASGVSSGTRRPASAASARAAALYARRRSASSRERRYCTIRATTERAEAGRSCSRPWHLTAHRKKSTARRTVSQRSRSGGSPGSHAARSPAKNTAAVRGGGGAAVTATQSLHAHPVTCWATGQSRNTWVMVSSAPAAAHAGRWQRAPAAPASSCRGWSASHSATRAATVSRPCIKRHARNLCSRGACTRCRRRHTPAQGRRGGGGSPPRGSSK